MKSKTTKKISAKREEALISNFVAILRSRAKGQEWTGEFVHPNLAQYAKATIKEAVVILDAFAIPLNEADGDECESSISDRKFNKAIAAANKEYEKRTLH